MEKFQCVLATFSFFVAASNGRAAFRKTDLHSLFSPSFAANTKDLHLISRVLRHHKLDTTAPDHGSRSLPPNMSMQGQKPTPHLFARRK